MTPVMRAVLADIPQVACRLSSKSPDEAVRASIFLSGWRLASRKRAISGGELAPFSTGHLGLNEEVILPRKSGRGQAAMRSMSAGDL